jgi:hypothetical protein
VDSGACPLFFRFAHVPQTTLRPGVFSTENPPGIILNQLKIGAQISEEMIGNFANLN